MNEFQRVHFIGVGGVGMSGIAHVLFERGLFVSGSDLKASRYVRELEDMGIPVTLGHTSQTIDTYAPDVVVISTAIPKDNPELKRARELNIPIWKRAQMLSWLAQNKKTIAVTGTHGKTTTSSMIALTLDKLGLDPSFLIGGTIQNYKTNARSGKGPYYVMEADESDASFLYLTPHVAVVTNVEADHLDHYHDFAEIQDAFLSFMKSVPADGEILVCAEDTGLLELAQRTGHEFKTYGTSPQCTYQMTPKGHEGLTSRAEVSAQGKPPVSFELHASPGIHNLIDATAALAVADMLGQDMHKAAQALSEFEGAKRRFTQIGTISGADIVDDYGHHPTEIQATLKAAKGLGYKRILVIFQPHRYSRTQAFLEDFASSFTDAEKVWILDVFAASEMPIPGISGRRVAKEMSSKGVDVAYSPRSSIVDTVLSELKEGDLLITMGAGDVTTIGPELLEAHAGATLDLTRSVMGPAAHKSDTQ